MITTQITVRPDYPWGDSTGSDPIADVRNVAATHFDSRTVLHLTAESIRALFRHPDVAGRYKHEWKYVFQVDDVQESRAGYDYVEFSKDPVTLDKPDPFHQHEALHSASICMDLFSDRVRDTVYVESKPEIIALCDAALEAMMQVYQAIGQEDME